MGVGSGWLLNVGQRRRTINSQPEAENVDQNEQDGGTDGNDLNCPFFFCFSAFMRLDLLQQFYKLPAVLHTGEIHSTYTGIISKIAIMFTFNHVKHTHPITIF